MYAKIPATRKAKSSNRCAQLLGAKLTPKVRLSRLLHKFQFVQRLLHLDYRPRTIHQFEAWLFLLDVARDEREQADGLARPRRHLQDSVASLEYSEKS